MPQVEPLRPDSLEGLQALFDSPNWPPQAGTPSEAAFRWLLSAGAGGAFGLYDSKVLVGACFSRVLGREGWVGPFVLLPGVAVETEGRHLLQAAIQHLLRKSVTTLGMESEPDADLLGWLGKEGFSPSAVLLSLEIPVASLPEEMNFWVDAYSALSAEQRAQKAQAVRQFCGHAAPGRDYFPLVAATQESGAGDTLLFSEKDELVGLAVVHKDPYYTEESPDAVQLHSVVCHTKRHMNRLDQIIAAAGGYARMNARAAVRLRCASDDPVTYQYLLSRGFRVRRARVRLALEGFPETRSAGYVVYSNWEM